MASKTAVDASRTNAWNIEPERLVLIADPAHPLYDPRVHLPLDESMVLNIMYHGVIEPVVICKDGDNLVVVDGRQRVKNAVEANRRLRAEGKLPLLVTCMIRKGDDANLFGVMVSTNELRREDTPLGRAEKLQRFMVMGRSEAEAAVVFGVSRQTIANWKALLDLDSAVKEAVENGVIGATVAAQVFAPLSREEQRKHLAEMTAGVDVSAAGGRPAVSGTAARKAVAGKQAAAPVSKMRSRAQVEKMAASVPADWTAAQALAWVLGGDP